MKNALRLSGWRGGIFARVGQWLAFFLTTMALAAQTLPPLYPEGPEAGRDLARQLRDLQPEENSEWRGTLKVRPKGGQPTGTPVKCQVVRGEGEWRVVYTTAATELRGAEQLSVLHSTNAPNQYLYARAATPTGTNGQPETLTGAAAEVPLAGSDFWLAELGMEFYHWPGQTRRKGEMRRGQPCYVLESVNPTAPAGHLARVVTYIEKESGQPILAEAYRAGDRKMFKEFSLGKVSKVNGRWVVKNLEITNRETGSKTWLEFDTGSAAETP